MFNKKKKNDKILRMEIKAGQFKDEEKGNVIKEIEVLNLDKLKYEILITNRKKIRLHNSEED
ncbi:MAG: hypothetical protein AB1410_09805 [Acidobacteriota bacterium]